MGDTAQSLTMTCRDRAQCPSESNQSRSVDLDQVTARLTQLSPERTSRRLSSPASTLPPLTEEEQCAEDRPREERSYHELVKDGGRPSHPLELLENVETLPEIYQEIVTFWQGEYYEPEE